MKKNNKEDGPNWTCVFCGSHEVHTIKYDTVGEPIDYDLECNICESTEIEEDEHSAFSRLQNKYEELLEKYNELEEKYHYLFELHYS